MVAERPSRDRRRIVMLYVENQQVVIVCGWFMQCADSQVLRYCGKEGTKNPHRREKECGKVRECVNVLVNSGMRLLMCMWNDLGSR